MDESSITISLDGLIVEATLGNEEALAALARDDSLLQLLDEVSNRAARFYGEPEEEDDIHQALWEAVRTKIGSLEKPGSIESWLWAVARNYCFRKKRHREVERFHRGRATPPATTDEDCETAPVTRSDAAQTPERVSVRRRLVFAHEVERSNATLTPEELLLQKEAESMWEEHKKRAREVANRFPAAVVKRWQAGMSVKEIRQETGIPLSTVYRILKNMERAILAEFGKDPDAK